MRTWPAPDVPGLPVTGPDVRLHDTASGERVPLRPDGPARLYVCGITPYDATHLGHAATYVAFDLLVRAWRSAGREVRYVQNVTDVDDPLLERARERGEDWREVAERETDLFRADMEALRVLPPEVLEGAVEAIPRVVDLVEELRERGSVYDVDGDLYFSVSADPAFAGVSGWDRERMLEVYPQRGGDPEREGKHDPLDCIVWRRERDGEPAWDTALGRGRPGWHVECTAIALEHLGETFDVQGGGSDLVFPHHEMCASEAQVARDGAPFARAYAHAGMVGYEGEKMSKSLGNLVLVSALRRRGVDPMAVRLVLLHHHYRSDWEWFDSELDHALEELDSLRRAVALGAGAKADPVVEEVLAALADDLDAPRAVGALLAWADATLGGTGAAADPSLGDRSDAGAGEAVRAVADAALGLAL